MPCHAPGRSPSAPAHARARPGLRPSAVLAVAALLATSLLAAVPAHALIHYDFEQKYFTHPGRQVWDFSIVRADGVYHIFYHTIPLSTP